MFEEIDQNENHNKEYRVHFIFPTASVKVHSLRTRETEVSLELNAASWLMLSIILVDVPSNLAEVT